MSVPNTINTMENPMTKNNPFRKIFLLVSFAFSGFFKSSADTPLINPRYAGTRGRVQGARKVSNPAKNTDMTNAMLIGSIYFFN